MKELVLNGVQTVKSFITTIRYRQLGQIILAIIGAATVLTYIYRLLTTTLLSYVKLVIFSPFALTATLALIGLILFFFRRGTKFYYGIVEVAVAMAACYNSSINVEKTYKATQVEEIFAPSSLSTWVAILSSVYLVVRGLTNIDEGRGKVKWLNKKLGDDAERQADSSIAANVDTTSDSYFYTDENNIIVNDNDDPNTRYEKAKKYLVLALMMEVDLGQIRKKLYNEYRLSDREAYTLPLEAIHSTMKDNDPYPNFIVNYIMKEAKDMKQNKGSNISEIHNFLRQQYPFLKMRQIVSITENIK